MVDVSHVCLTGSKSREEVSADGKTSPNVPLASVCFANVPLKLSILEESVLRVLHMCTQRRSVQVRPCRQAGEGSHGSTLSNAS